MTAVTRLCHTAPLPRAHGLPVEVAAGRACVACGQRLTTGAVLLGRAPGRHGAHDVSVEVWACPAPEGA